MAVYCLVDVKRDACKVGFSKDQQRLDKRIKTLQTASPFELIVFGIRMDLNQSDEKALHRLLKDHDHLILHVLVGKTSNWIEESETIYARLFWDIDSFSNQLFCCVLGDDRQITRVPYGFRHYPTSAFEQGTGGGRRVIKGTNSLGG